MVKYYIMRTPAFVKRNIKKYKRLKPYYCPALQDTVHFTSTGLNHLLYNRRRPRSYNERHYRAGLIPHLKSVIKNSNQAIKKIESNNPLVVTWELKHLCKVNRRNQIVKVILVKEGAGNIKFLSAMSRAVRGNKRKKRTKNPR